MTFARDVSTSHTFQLKELNCAWITVLYYLDHFLIMSFIALYPVENKWASGGCCSSDAYVVMYSRSTEELTYVSILLFLSKASQSPHVHIYREWERERDWCVNSPPFWCLSRTIAMCAQIMMLMVDTRVEDPLAQLITIIVLPTHCHRRGGGEERREEARTV